MIVNGERVLFNRKLIVILILSVCLSTHTVAELLSNPGFETGDKRNPWNEGTMPDDWSKDDHIGWATWKDVSQAEYPYSPHSGNNCVVAGSNTDGGYGLWRQNVPADPCKTYRCSLWAMTEDWGSPNAEAIIDFKSSGGFVLASENMNIFNGSLSDSWENYSFLTDYSPWGTETIDFTLYCDPHGSPMFDDVSLTEVSSQPCPDFNRDQKVGVADAIELAVAWLDDRNDPGYDEMIDLDNSDRISIGDVAILSEYWLEDRTVPVPVDAVITIDAAQTYQQIDGFGASLTDSSAWLFAYAMDASQKQAALTELFDPAAGIGLTYLRQPMGTSDFRVGSSMGGHDDYTYDDMPTGQVDFDLSEFSIAKDEKYIIPVLQDIRAVSSNVKIMGSPWSAPHWMKNGEQLGGGTLRSDVYDTYAQYFVNYIQAYDAHGLTIDAITLQNEPYYEPWSYHGTKMEPADQIKLVLAMGPLFDASGINADILVWDHNWDRPDYPIEVLNNADAKAYITGSAFHHYGGNVTAQTQVHNEHPDRDIHFTEGSNGSWQSPGFDNNFIGTTSRMISIIRNWSKTFITWNLALDQNNGPKIPGGCDTCYGVITIDQSDGTVSRRPQYYTFGHSSKFVRPGAHRIHTNDTTAANIENVAFVNADGSHVLIALNSDSSVRTIRVDLNGQSFEYSMPPRSAATFKWHSQINTNVEVWLTTGDQSKLLSREANLQF
jgi:glucosylceramidase